MNEIGYHIDFKLHGKSFDTVDSLLSFSKTISKEVFSFLENWFDFSDSIRINTSGSTGNPKSIMLKKKHMINSALATGLYFDLKPKTTALLCLSTNYIAGKMMLVRAIVLGWHLDIIEPKSNPLVDIEKQYNFSAMIPLQLSNSLNKINLINKLLVGGGVVSNELKSKIKNLTTKIYATYGMTETITHIAVKPLNKAPGLTLDKDVYQILPNVILSKDSRSCLVIDAPNVSDKKVITNDLVELISSTEFKWLGRFDNIINSGGIKLIPEQIEENLQTIINNRYFITSLIDSVLGDKIVLVVEGKVQENLKSQISTLKSIGKYEIPKEIYFIDKFIETKTKKIQRKQTLDLILFKQ